MRTYFMTTTRLGFSKWTYEDIKLAQILWGEKDVARFICAKKSFTLQEIQDRLDVEMRNDEENNIQYWPIFDRTTSEFIGCCGLRPWMEEIDGYEFGVHLRKEYWRKGFAKEAAQAVISHAFSALHVKVLFAGHHPDNIASKVMLEKLGFQYVNDVYYEPTGLYHPSYRYQEKG